MSRPPFILWFACLPGLLAAAPLQPRQDMLRFVNGDQLHGSFQGIKEGGVVVWQRADLVAAGEFKSTEIQKVVLRAGRPEKSNQSLAHVALVNGNRIPGTLIELNDETLSVETSFAGVMHIPRKQVGMVAPVPLGGRVLYHGPYSEDGWLMTHPSFPDGIPAPSPATDKDKDKDKDKDRVEDEDGKAVAEVAKEGEDEKLGKEEQRIALLRWEFSGDAWYWNKKQGSTALVRKDVMAERSILRFKLAWRNHLMLCLAFHADFARPPKPAAKNEGKEQAKADVRRLMLNRQGSGDTSSFPQLFGNSYVLQINSGYAILMRSGYDADGKPILERLQMNNPSIRLPESGAATLELRCDRPKGVISLYVDGDFAMQWSEPSGAEEGGYAGKGGGIGFLVQMENSPVRISDIVIAEWNGMLDSARSMQVNEQDIVLLANGTDRFSGKVTGYQDGKLGLRGKFGDFHFPLGEIAEVRFATNSLDKPEEMIGPKVIVRLDPIGHIYGKLLSGDAKALKLSTPYAGNINLKLESAIILDFQPSNNLLDDWDPQF